jgi:hypothetical protein
LIAAATLLGILVESTLGPTDSAVFGLTPWTDAAVLASFDRAVELKRAAPERLVAEGVEAKDLAPARDETAPRGRHCRPRGLCLRA